MQAGRLRHRVSFQAPVTASDPFQTNTKGAWNTVYTCWAAIEPLSSKDFYAQGSQSMQVTHTVTIRYPGKTVQIGSGYQILYIDQSVTRTFQVLKGIMNKDERNFMVQFSVVEVNPTVGGIGV